MPLHRLTSITVGVPNVAPTAAYYAEFGLIPSAGGGFGTADGGEQPAGVRAALSCARAALTGRSGFPPTRPAQRQGRGS
jgi:hypothetical protein